MRTQVYFGEMHTHTFCDGGRWGTVEEAAEIATRHLDFWAPAEHACMPKCFDWERIVRAVRKVHSDGRFVAFPGLEVGDAEGDFNVYFPKDDMPGYVYEDGTLVVEDFFDYARKHGGIVAPHHTGYRVGARGMQWKKLFRQDLMPIMEIFSMHGSSESDEGYYPLDLGWMGPRESGGCAMEGLKRGFRFGFIASSDGHNGYPGTYGMGLAAVYAEALTREAILKALRERRCYAVTGDRIRLEFHLDHTPMGGVIEPGDRKVRFLVRGLDVLDAVDVIKNGTVIHRTTTVTAAGRGHKSSAYVVRVGYGWGSRGRYEWNGTLRVINGELQRALPCFGPPPPDNYKVEGNSVLWQSTTHGYSADWTTNRYRCGDECAMVMEIAGDEATGLEAEINGRRFRRTIGEMLAGARIEFAGFQPARAISWYNVPKLKFYAAVPETLFRIQGEFDDEAKPGDFYYLRVRQCNGQMAWASPIFCI